MKNNNLEELHNSYDGNINDVSKNGHAQYFNRLFSYIGDFCFQHRLLVIFLTTLVFTSSVLLSMKVNVDMTFKSFFEAEDTAFIAHEHYKEAFGSEEASYIAYRVPGKEHGPFDLEVMSKIKLLTKALEEEVPFVSKVTSLVNVEITTGDDDGLNIFKMADDFPETQESLLEIKKIILDKPFFIGGMVSADAEYAAVIVEMEKSIVDPPEELIYDKDKSPWLDNLYPQVSDTTIENILARPEFEGIEFHHAGDVPWNSKYNTIMTNETMKIAGLTYLLIGVFLLLFFGGIRGVIGPFIVVTIATVFAVALLVVLGWQLDLMFPFVPSLIIAIGIVNSVHVIAQFNSCFNELGNRRKAIQKTMYLVATPCMLSSLTTALGLLAMSGSNIKSLSHLSVYSSLSILLAFILSITFLVALLSFGKDKLVTKKKQEKKKNIFVSAISVVSNKISDINSQHYKLVLLITLFIFAFSIYGVSQLHIDNNFLEEFKADEPIRLTTEMVDEHMGGTNSIVYLFNTDTDNGIKDPAVLREIERVQAFADQDEYLVRKSSSIVDIIKDINKSFHGDNPDYYVIPDDKELIAQLLLVYEFSGGEDLKEYVSSDYRTAALELRTRMVPTSRMTELANSIDQYLQDSPLQYSSVVITGMGALWMRFAGYISESQIEGIILAFCVIFLIMCLIYRSIKIGTLSMIANVTPVLLTLGYMGIMGIDLDYTRLLLAPLAIGIAVDDTIHFVSRFKIEFQRLGNYVEAMRESLHHVGRALIMSTVILVAGFGVNIFHGLDTQVFFGILISCTIIGALVADLFIMPSLILLFKVFGPEFDPNTKTHDADKNPRILAQG